MTISKSLQHSFPYLVFPLLMTAAVSATFAFERSVAFAFPLSTLVLFLVIAGLEKKMPRRREWVADDGLKLQDTGHSLFGTILGGKLGEALTEALVPALMLQLAGPGKGALWPKGLPLPLQVILVFLCADLGRYLQHRLMHHYPLLWRFHSLHHSIETLTVWKTSRSHLVERVFQQLFMFGPLIAAGVPARVLLFYVVPNTFLGLFAHSNLDSRLGPVENVIMGPGAHRIHHSLEIHEGNSNFGSALVIWDRVFGTYLAPMKRPDPERVGIREDRTPAGFLAQLWQPFRRGA